MAPTQALDRALETGSPVLAYVRDGKVAWWAVLEEGLTGDVKLRLFRGGIRDARLNASSKIGPDGELTATQPRAIGHN